MISVQDKIVIITGASRGIGKATALLFGEKGARVVIAARSQDDSEKTASEMIKKNPKSEVLAVVSDVTQEKSIKNLVQQAIQKFGGIDILVNNAGIGINKPVAEFTTLDWDLTLDTNLKGPFLISREVLPIMIKQRGGQIINISSGAGKNPIKNYAAYCASKFGLIGFSESLALEVRNYNIKVSVLLPGTTATHFGDKKREYVGLRPKNSLLPKEVAEAILTLATQEPQAWTSEMNLRPLIIEP
ncbi:MAG: Short-chain dehydrogenase/reductase SDR [candidate division Zixibacteria bacterium RBG-1]|nr:MAG: Short-chain dehydrogenase/reductase SDR [candidate division Zixibacteria bacterium RBG-1]OGC86352.1 MAG: hypothetical protein A2V73_02500 [candidate division Zixibacteria bacterium RBG_19FT_COMBO_42_43]